jgi:large subunit ribosomal protein L10
MARPEKVAVVAEISERLQSSSAALLTEYRGLSVDDLAQLRRQLREHNAEYRVVKNTLTRRAVVDAGMSLPDELLTGPTALTFCDGDPVAATKVLKRFSERHPALVIKGGVVEGQLLGAEQAHQLAELQSREELLSRLAGVFNQVLAQPAQLAQAGLSKMARLLSAYHSQREEAGETAASPPVGADGADADAGEDAAATGAGS